MRPMRSGLKPGGGNQMENGSLAPAVEDLWNTWEIHSMILTSLFLQVFLFLFAGWRRQCASAPVRIVLWLAYLSADSVAVFVLGHLAVRVSEPGHQLMAFWAPFVLVHLGGQDTITAFSMEDNQLWKRHLLNLAIQVAVAGYVVSKASWPDHRLKMAMVLMFICGSFKYAERIVYLYFARPKFLTSDKAWKLYGQGRDYDKMKKDANKHMKRTLINMSNGTGPTSAIDGLMEGFSLTTDIMAGKTPVNKVASITLADEGKLPNMLADFRSNKDRHRAYEHVGALLLHCYRRLYTKGYVRDLFFDFTGWFSRREGSRSTPSWSARRVIIVLARIIFQGIFYMLPTLFTYVATAIALALFMAADKGASVGGSTGSGRADIIVSYILLVGALVLDVCSVANFYFSRPCCSSIQPEWYKKQWSKTLGQYNIIKSVDTNWLCRLCGKDVGKPEITEPIKEFILDSLVASGTRKEWNIASTRGQLALHKWSALTALKESIRSGVDFPTSVLILHIATCISNEATSFDGVKKLLSIELSNYIMYLVFKCNVMLTTTSRFVHHEVRTSIGGISRQINWDEIDKDAIMERFSQEINKLEQGGSKEHDGQELKEQDEIQIEIIEHEESKEEDEIQIEIIDHDQESAKNDSEPDNHMKKLLQSGQVLYSPQALLRSACSVAQELNSIEDEAERWALIAAVWAEMLYYTAPRCGAAFHYEHLSKGGEFITHVLVLMLLLGPFMPPPDA